MANPKTDGRMIRVSISDSKDFAALSPEAAVLFCMIIPHLNSHGKLQGGPAFVKEIVCPKISYLDANNIPTLMAEISQKTDIKWFTHDSRHWIHALRFTDHQKLKTEKLGTDSLPDYVDNLSSELVQSNSELKKSSPELVPHEEEVEEEVEEEAKGKSGVKCEHGDIVTADSSFDANEDEKKRKEFLSNLKSILKNTEDKYPGPYEQRQILLFVQSNIRKKNPEAIMHCINSLIRAPDKVKAIPQWLDAALKIEDGKYNAADSEKIGRAHV